MVFTDKAPEEITAVVKMRRAHILIVFIVFLIVVIFASVSHTKNDKREHNISSDISIFFQPKQSNSTFQAWKMEF